MHDDVTAGLSDSRAAIEAARRVGTEVDLQ